MFIISLAMVSAGILPPEAAFSMAFAAYLGSTITIVL
jgi:Na+/phosphate symporter